MTDFTVGIIVKPHGVRGELRVFPTTDDPERFSLLDKVAISVPGRPDTVYRITASRTQKNMVILKLKDVNDRNTAEILLKGEIKIPPGQALPLETDQYYIRDLIGLSVWADTGEELGVLADVLTTGANDVYVINTGGKDILLPAIKSCILSVSLTEKTMRVHVPEGLME